MPRAAHQCPVAVMAKPTTRQLQVIALLRAQCKYWAESNDLHSTSHGTEIDSELVLLQMDGMISEQEQEVLSDAIGQVWDKLAALDACPNRAAQYDKLGVAPAEPGAGPSAVSAPSSQDAAAVPNAAERVLCAAIHIDDGVKHEHQPCNIHTGFVVAGRRHHNCIYTASLLGELSDKVRHAMKQRNNQGFLTTHDRYVSRSTAYEIAREQGQLLAPELISEILTSEDLY